MKKIFKWMGVVVIILIVVGFVFDEKEKNVPVTNASFSQTKYALTSREITVMKFVLLDEMAAFASGQETLFDANLTKVSSVEVARAYEDNQVAADQKYFKKTLLLTGYISSINSGLGNEPYLTLHGINQFMSPQVHFKKQDVGKIADLKRGQKIDLICIGDGVIIGSPMFKNCQFAKEYIDEQMPVIKREILEFLDGKKVPKFAAAIPTFSIALTKSLAETSTCFTNGSQCGADIRKLTKQNDFKKNITTVVAEMKAAGLQVPNLRSQE